ncbi:MAG: PVC-type heme-binding CxxCH protein [Planctomycetota bacterium]
MSPWMNKLSLAIGLWMCGSTVHAVTPFTLSDGDVVAFVGDGLIEQEQYAGWVEVMLSTAFPDSDVTFRNLGWNGDTPTGASRSGLSLVQAGRESEGESWRQLQAQIQQVKPTVAVIGYGMSSLLDEVPADSFIADLRDLIRHIKHVNVDCRVVLLSPLKPSGPSAVTNQAVEAYTDAMNKLSIETGAHFIELSPVAPSHDQRKDAIHLNESGYRHMAKVMQTQLELQTRAWDRPEATERLRQAIVEKNRWWFHRSRPANMAYVFGFRKREQGQNAVEIPQFDPLIAAEEKRIAALRSLKPVSVEPKPIQLNSQYAEFTPQPRPDFVVADGLEVTLWAENPLLNKPIHMNFDAKGRLWIASSEAYPMIEVGQSLPDKVVVLEDSDNDGRADHSTVFADGLLIPTGIMPCNDGVYVAQSTDLLLLTDKDGDGVADHRERVLSGFGTEDTHHNLHTLVFGPDGHLYMNQSVYTRSDVETPFGVVRLRAGGGFRFDTHRKHMRVFFRGLWNPWGHQFDAYGNSFMTDGAGFDGLAYVFPSATFHPTPKARRPLALISPGKYPKFCGGEIVRGPSFPEDWQDTYVTCDFRANRVTRFSISESDSGFVTTQQPDLIRTTQSSFRPIDVKQGPDGALYIADWSNPIINHGEVDFRDPRRDRWHGRIWRVAFKDQPHPATVDLSVLDIPELFGMLLSDDRYQCDQSRRVLIRRREETVTQLRSLWSMVTTPTDKLHAVRLSASVGQPDLQWLENVLDSKDGRARAAATRIIADWSDPSDPARCLDRNAALGYFSQLVGDPHPRVRLEAVCGCSRLGGIEAVRRSLSAVDRDVDRFIEHALLRCVEDHEVILVNDLDSDYWHDIARSKQFEFVLTSIAPAQASSFLARYVDQNGITRDGRGPWIELIARAGEREQLEQLYQQLIQDGFEDAAAERALDALTEAMKSRKVKPDLAKLKAGASLRRLIMHEDMAVRLAAIELMGTWKTKFLVPELSAMAADASNPDVLRGASVKAIQRCGGRPAAVALVQLASSQSNSVATGAVMGLAQMDPTLALKSFFQVVQRFDQETVLLGLWRAMLSQPEAGPILASSLPKGISEVAARAGIRAAREPGRDAQALVDALMPLSGLSLTASEWSSERAAEIRELVESHGDPARGELIYRRSQIQCTSCHAVGGVGGNVGPDMTSLGTSAPVDYIIESLFDPNAKIKENYHTLNVLTEDGRVVSGIELSRTDGFIRLRDATGVIVEILEDDVLETRLGQSLMPANLLDRIPQDEQIDLIAFLTQLGKPGEFDASKQDVARVLEVFAGTHRVEQAGNQSIISGQRVEGWKPIQSRASGKLHAKDLYAATAQPFNISLVNLYLRTRIELATETNVTFEIEGVHAAKLWIDGQQGTEISEAVRIKAGRHTALFQIDARELPESIVIRGDSVTFLTNPEPSS